MENVSSVREGLPPFTLPFLLCQTPDPRSSLGVSSSRRPRCGPETSVAEMRWAGRSSRVPCPPGSTCLPPDLSERCRQNQGDPASHLHREAPTG